MFLFWNKKTHSGQRNHSIASDKHSSSIVVQHKAERTRFVDLRRWERDWSEQWWRWWDQRRGHRRKCFLEHISGGHDDSRWQWRWRKQLGSCASQQ